MTDTGERPLLPGDSILLVQLRAMGDSLLLTPLIRALKKSYPDVHLDILLQSLPLQALRNNPHIRTIHPAPPSNATPFAYITTIAKLRRAKFRMVFDLLCTPATALITALTAAPSRIGYHLRGRSWAYTATAPRSDCPQYNPESKFGLVKHLGIEPDGLLPEIFPDESNRRAADGIWDKNGLGRFKHVIGLAPWSKRRWRRWENAEWIKVIRSIPQVPDCGFLLFAAADERDRLREIEQHAGTPPVIWAGADELLTTAELMARCKFLLCADNGLKHVAVAVGIPTLTVFVASDPRVWNPPDTRKYPYVCVPQNRCDPNAIRTGIHEKIFKLLKLC